MSDKYAALRAAAEKATPGEWCAFTDEKSKTYSVHTAADKRCGDIINWPGFDGRKNAQANAEFIAAANPATILELLAECDADKRRIAELGVEEKTSTARREALERAHSMYQRERDRAELAEKRVAELEVQTLSVKLPDGYAVRSGHPINEGERGVMIPKEGGDWLHRFDVEHALQVAGVSLKEKG